MGFKYEVDELPLTFEGKLAGLEVDVREVGAEQHDRLLALRERAAGEVTTEGGILSRVVLANLRDLCRELAEVVLSWNLEDKDGHPVPCTAEAMESQGMSFQLALANGWCAAVAVYADSVATAAVPAPPVKDDAASDFDPSALPMDLPTN